MLTAFVRALVLYLVLIIAMRILGKRQLGQLEPSEVVVAMLVADLAADPMLNPTKSLWAGLLPIGAVLGMEYLLSILAMHSIPLRKLLCGKPVILMENGTFLQKNMRRTRVTVDELVSKLREKDVLDLNAVQYAILETGGNLSVFLYPEERTLTPKDMGISVPPDSLPVTIISDGSVLLDNLKKAGKNQKWLKKQMQNHKTAIKNVFLMTVDGENRICIHKKQNAEY